MRLAKLHGLGNDFLVALAADNPELAADPELARSLCDRHRGVGADGLILGLPPSDPRNDVAMVLVNSDGSAAEISGNGIRCLAQAILRGRTGENATLRIESPGGVRDLRVVGGDVRDELWIDVDMGPTRAGPDLVPAVLAYPSAARTTLDMGNPHLVLLVDDPGAVDLEHDGPALESEFAGGINVHFVAPLAHDRLELRVWERGAGATEACGSGAAAAVVAALGWGAVRGRVTVEMPGGSADVEVIDGRVHLIGPSNFVAEVVVP